MIVFRRGHTRQIDTALECHTAVHSGFWFETNYTTQPNVLNVAVPSCSASSCDIGRIAQAVYGKLGQRADRHYVVFYAGQVPGLCGQAGLIGSKVADSSNANITSPGLGVVYNTDTYDATPPPEYGGRSVRSCWQTASNLHESLHTLGATQGIWGQYRESIPPYSTFGGHCYDGRDVMCYNDGSPNGQAYSDGYCPSFVALDCMGDTYLNVFPAANSWLSKNWNIGAAYDQYVWLYQDGQVIN
jgi:hypothetical protein